MLVLPTVHNVNKHTSYVKNRTEQNRLEQKSYRAVLYLGSFFIEIKKLFFIFIRKIQFFSSLYLLKILHTHSVSFQQMDYLLNSSLYFIERFNRLLMFFILFYYLYNFFMTTSYITLKPKI